MAVRPLQEEIERLRLLRNSPADSSSIASLRKALKDRSNLMVAEAAKLVGAIHANELIPELLQAYDRMFENPVKSDPKCWAKTAIVKTLTELDYEDSAPFLRGIVHVQMEPVWGDHEDTASSLRSGCILALPQCSDLRRSEIFRRLIDALQDPVGQVRIDAIRAIEQMNGEDAQLLLRMKARFGDSEPEVTGQAFDAILNLESEKGIAFVSEYLKSTNTEIRDEAALSIGSSRQTGGAEMLVAAWNNTVDPEFRQVLLRALSASRTERALQFLLSLIREGSKMHAQSVVESLKIHQESPDIQVRIEKAIEERRSDGLPSITGD